MKFALVFLLGLVVFSHQQFYQQPERDKVLWLLPYYSPQPSFDNYNYQPANYHHSEMDRTAPFFNHLSSTGIQIYSQVTTKPRTSHLLQIRNDLLINYMVF